MMEANLQAKSEPTKNHSRKIKRLLIYPRFQLLLLFANFCVLFLIFGFIALLEYRAFSRFWQLGQDIHLSAAHPYFVLLHLQASSLLAGIALALLVGFLVSSCFMLVLSHRLAGPIVRLRGYFSEISQNKQVNYPLKFRKGDFFSELPPQINEALKTLKPQ